MYDSLQWWQVLLGAALLALAVGGVAGLIVSIRRRRRADPTARALALVSLASLALAVVGRLTVGGYAKAKYHGPPRPSLNDSRGFVSSTPPAVSIKSAPGWTTSHDPEKGVVVVQTGTEGEASWSALTVMSTRLDNPMDMKKMRDTVLAAIRNNPQLELEGTPVDTTIAGLPATRFSKKFPGTHLRVCSWQVRRGRSYAAIVHCATATGRDPCTACGAALQTLEWVAPSGVPAEDL